MGSEVRCRFKCNSKTESLGTTYNPDTKQYDPCTLYQYSMGAVTDKEGVNARFFHASPSGQFQVSAVRDDLFRIGATYEFSISEVSGEQ